MHVRSRDLRTRLGNLRGPGALIVVLSLLVYLNVAAMADQADSTFRGTAFGQDLDLSSVLAAHQADLVHFALLEYSALILGLAGLVLLVAGPGLKRALAR